MSDSNVSTATPMSGTEPQQVQPQPTNSDKEVVSTHVLVEPEKVEQLRELSRRSRIAQSEYLREAVDDLLTKYDRLGEE